MQNIGIQLFTDIFFIGMHYCVLSGCRSAASRSRTPFADDHHDRTDRPCPLAKDTLGRWGTNACLMGCFLLLFLCLVCV